MTKKINRRGRGGHRVLFSLVSSVLSVVFQNPFRKIIKSLAASPSGNWFFDILVCVNDAVDQSDPGFLVEASPIV